LNIPEHLKHQKIFFELGEKLGYTTAVKNDSYGDAFLQIVKIFEILYPDGISVEQYKNATLLVRVLDKICRISNGNANVFDEDAFLDLGGYSLIGMVDNKKEKK